MATDITIRGGSLNPKNPLISPEVETSPVTPLLGTRGLFPKADGWYDIDDEGNVSKLGGEGGDTSDCVHKTGDEVIKGLKNFTDGMKTDLITSDAELQINSPEGVSINDEKVVTTEELLSVLESVPDEIPSVAYSALDNFTDGLYKVIKTAPQLGIVENVVFGKVEGGYDFITSTEDYVFTDILALCLAYRIFDSINNKTIYHQMLILADGGIYTRQKSDTLKWDIWQSREAKISVIEGEKTFKDGICVNKIRPDTTEEYSGANHNLDIETMGAITIRTTDAGINLETYYGGSIDLGSDGVIITDNTNIKIKTLDGYITLETGYGNKIYFDNFGIHLSDNDAELVVSEDGVKVGADTIATELYVNSSIKQAIIDSWAEVIEP